MSRSISEIYLFQCDEDKQYYISLLKKYKERYRCRIYAYILMDNHTHIYIHPCGYDISLFMCCLNNAYVAYFNRKYKRHGHLYQGRFASSIVDNDTYSLKLSAYIHNNARDIPGYAGKEEQYRYSSYGVYTGYRKEIDGLVDTEFILNHFGKDIKSARTKYGAFVESMKGTGIMKEVDESITRAYTKNEYVSKKCYIAGNRAPEEIIYRISDLLCERLYEGLRRKYSRETAESRAFVTYIMRILCGYTYQDVCEYIGNMSISGVSRLSNQGFKLLKEITRYRNAFNSLIQAV
jgi:REP element-mobilizing transposase RayT